MSYQSELRAERDALRAALEEWRQYFNCDSPHDSHAGHGTLLGKEQVRANIAENKLAALRAERDALAGQVAELRKALESAKTGIDETSMLVSADVTMEGPRYRVVSVGSRVQKAVLLLIKAQEQVDAALAATAPPQTKETNDAK